MTNRTAVIPRVRLALLTKTHFFLYISKVIARYLSEEKKLLRGLTLNAEQRSSEISPETLKKVTEKSTDTSNSTTYRTKGPKCR